MINTENSKNLEKHGGQSKNCSFPTMCDDLHFGVDSLRGVCVRDTLIFYLFFYRNEITHMVFFPCF